MALYPCPECKKEVSDKAKECPHCGAKLKLGAFQKILIFIGGSLALLVAGSIVMYAFTPKYELEASSKREACIKIAKIMGQPGLISTCHDDYYADIRMGKLLESGRENSTAVEPQRNIEWEAKQKIEDEEWRKKCIDNMKEIKSEYKRLSGKNDWHQAGLKVWRCAELTNDSEYVKFAEEATKHRIKK